MIDIPVFGDGGFGKMILGYLDSAYVGARAFRAHESFQMIAYDPPPIPLRIDDMPMTAGTATLLTFTWHTRDSSRGPRDLYEERGRHRVFFLEVDNAELLGKVKGFKWFAERHGDIVHDVPAAVRGGTRVR